VRNIRNSRPNLLSTLVKHNPEIQFSVYRKLFTGNQRGSDTGGLPKKDWLFFLYATLIPPVNTLLRKMNLER
jgi:hypothetical protein